MLLDIFFTLTLLFSFAWSQDCSCSQNLYPDPDRQCYNVSSDLVYSRYICPVGNLNYCGSVYCLGFPSCNSIGAVNARNTACEAIGGSINDGLFICKSQVGSDQSEVNCQFSHPLSSTSQPTNSPLGSFSPSGQTGTTNAPTSSATGLFMPLIVFFGPLCYTLFSL